MKDNTLIDIFQIFGGGPPWGYLKPPLVIIGGEADIMRDVANDEIQSSNLSPFTYV